MLIRVFIVALLILNVGVAAWWLARPDQRRSEHGLAAAPVEPSGAGIPRLVLADEHDAEATRPIVSPGAPEPSLPEAAAGSADFCVSHGPFATAEAAAVAQRLARAAGASAGVRAQAAAPYRGWKVWLPPFENLEQAQQMAAEVAAAGFTDQFIVREGPDAGSLALGRFASEAPARQHAEKLVAAGFPARADPIGSGAISYWLDVSGSRPDAQRLRDQVAAPQALKVDCETWR